ncbi:MAG: hypothetical protein FWB98_07025 [Defluviitaleaceae bacterium]|nr:hypothetical protein [Defluviitaleaceae bacterium]
MSQFPNQPPPYTPPPHYYSKPPGDGMATAALVLGIIAIAIFPFNPIPFLEVIIGGIGIGLAVSAKSQGNSSGKVTGGLICSIIGMVLGGLFWVACFACACAPFCAIPFL